MPQSSKAFLDSDLEREKKKEKHSQLLYRQPPDRRRWLSTGQSPILYTQGCCWRVRSVQPDLDGRIPCRRDTSFLLQCPAAFPPTGWLWTDHHVSEKKKKKSDILAEGSEGHKSGAAPTRDFFFFFSDVQTLRYICFLVCSEVCTHPEEFVQRTVLHVLDDNHDWFSWRRNKGGTIKRDMINWYLFCFPPKVHITTK